MLIIQQVKHQARRVVGRVFRLVAPKFSLERAKMRDAIALYEHTSRLGSESPNEWIRKSASIPGWLFEGEHEFLWELASRPVAGDVLEVGSWMGKSTCILAGATIVHAPQSRVWCVDPFDLRGNAWQLSYHRLLVRDRDSTFELFRANAKKAGFLDQLVPVTCIAEQVLPSLKLSLRMVFLDGTHEYDNVASETAWLVPQLASGGVIAYHDVSVHYPGVLRFVDEQLMQRPDLRLIDRRGTIAAFERI